jgi:hypothetical protein
MATATTFRKWQKVRFNGKPGNGFNGCEGTIQEKPSAASAKVFFGHCTLTCSLSDLEPIDA